MKIKTNNHWYPILYSYEIPDKVLKNQFDWMANPDEYQFFKYRGYYYTTSDFLRIENRDNSQFSSYDGYRGDSFFSGVLVRFSECSDMLQCATYYS